jgi:peptidoglycan hydrolase-like protein with peptidoglycan-binding domain
VDGVPGPMTRSATIRFQRRAHLTADGVAGPQTRRALGRRGRPLLGTRSLASPTVGWDVASVQFLLWRRGFSPGAIDGAFGYGTTRAVVAFQRSVGITGDGVVGPQTIRALERRRTEIQPNTSVRFYRPVSGPMGDGFGHIGGRRHTGIDFPAASGTPIKAAGRGVVVFAGWNTGGYGNLVVVAHRLGFATWYAHMSRISVRPGRAVTGGTILGRVGATGHATGPHVHFEVRRFEVPIDPMPYLLASTAARLTATTSAGGALECGPGSGGQDHAGASRGPRRIARARLAGC